MILLCDPLLRVPRTEKGIETNEEDAVFAVVSGPRLFISVEMGLPGQQRCSRVFFRSDNLGSLRTYLRVLLWRYLRAMHDEHQTTNRSLSELVEMIVERGTISPQDQYEINRLAQGSTKGADDAQAVVRLTDLITGGKISVI